MITGTMSWLVSIKVGHRRFLSLRGIGSGMGAGSRWRYVVSGGCRAGVRLPTEKAFSSKLR
jgi:hypothetical protein